MLPPGGSGNIFRRVLLPFWQSTSVNPHNGNGNSNGNGDGDGYSQQSYCNKISCRCLEPSRNCSAFGFLELPPSCIISSLRDRKMKLVLRIHTHTHTHTQAVSVGKLSWYIIYRLCLTPAFYIDFFLFFAFRLNLGVSRVTHKESTYIYFRWADKILQAHTHTRISVSLSTCSCGQTRLGVGLATPNALTELKSDHPLPENCMRWQQQQQRVALKASTHTQTHSHTYTCLNNVYLWTELHTKKSEEANTILIELIILMDFQT